MKITMAHGSGGAATSKLIEEIFADAYGNDILARMEDAAVLSGEGRIAMTTDSFVVTPIQFPGGDIGRLAVCGTVNDLLMCGAKPKYLSCAMILQEGLELETLKEVVKSLAETAKEAGVMIVCGDTKVIEGNGGMMINTTGIGFVPEERNVGGVQIQPGDAIIVSGMLGDHHATILSSRLAIENEIQSDNAPLNEMVEALFDHGIDVHAMRDVTRGGLATVLKEMSDACGQSIEIEEEKLPVRQEVKDFCGLLGLEPLYMGNEGKMVIALPENQAQKAVDLMRNSKYGQDAGVIGRVNASEKGELILLTAIGGKRRLDVLQGEGLPRIC